MHMGPRTSVLIIKVSLLVRCPVYGPQACVHILSTFFGEVHFDPATHTLG